MLRIARTQPASCLFLAAFALGACGEAPSDPQEALASRSPEAAIACSADDAGSPSLYPRVVEILERSCAYQRCHAGAVVGAGLPFELGADHRAVLVGVEACEYERMARVEPGHPERSWLWVKLTAPFRPLTDPYAHTILFAPPPGWDPDQRRCRDRTDEGIPLFGQRMPSTAPNTLPPEELEVIRRWILDGARP